MRAQIAVIFGAGLLLWAPCFGQRTTSTAQTAASSNSDTPANSQKVPEQKPQKKKKRRGDFVVAPIPIASPALGTGIIPVGGYIFRLREEDQISPPSVVGAAGLITNNGTRAFAVAAELYMKRDTYHATAAFLQGNLNYNLYGIGIISGNAGAKLPLSQEGSVFAGELLRKTKWKICLGPRVSSGHSLITIRPGEVSTVAIPPDLGISTKLTSLGFHLNRDTRPNRFYPTAGTLFDFTADVFANALGSKYSFQSYRATFNKYWSVHNNQVLAYNAYLCATGGDPPFYGNCIYGTNNELRGYEAGRYLDPYMAATQLEYRLSLPRRFGVVAFGGIGGISDNGRDFLRSNSLLPAAGGGLRFMLSKSYHVNLRADLAAGKNEHTFSMGLSEAF